MNASGLRTIHATSPAGKPESAAGWAQYEVMDSVDCPGEGGDAAGHQALMGPGCAPVPGQPLAK